MKQSKTMSFIHHWVRPLWSFPLMIIYFIIHLAMYVLSKKIREQYKLNKSWFEKRPITFYQFAEDFRKCFHYKYDGFGYFTRLFKKLTTYYYMKVESSDTYTLDLILYVLFGVLYKTFGSIRGLLDHDSTQFEYYIAWDDCDGAKHIQRRLKEMKLGPVKIGMIVGNNIKTWHYNCIYYDSDKQTFTLFNYGYFIEDQHLRFILHDLCKANNWDFKKLKYWVCKW